MRGLRFFRCRFLEERIGIVELIGFNRIELADVKLFEELWGGRLSLEKVLFSQELLVYKVVFLVKLFVALDFVIGFVSDGTLASVAVELLLDLVIDLLIDLIVKFLNLLVVGALL